MRQLFLLTLLSLGPVALASEAGGTLRPGVTYHYVKSNLDGSDPWHVTTYVSSRTRLDVLKWGEGPGEVVEVTADLDPSRCVAHHLEQWNLRDGALAMSMWATLSEDGRSYAFHREGAPPLVLRGSGRPLHVYGFDLQSMDLGPRCLATRAGVAVIGLLGVNPVPDAAPPLVDFGPVRVEQAGEEQLGEIRCRKVRLVGTGFTVLAWFSRADGRVVRAESARPDSHDWTSFRLQLVRTEPMDPFRWQAFRGEVLSRFIHAAPPPAISPAGPDAGPH